MLYSCHGVADRIMPKIHIDLRFADVLYELSATELYISSFESQLPFMVKQEREKVLARIKREGLNAGDGEVDLIYQELYDLTEEVLPRFFRGAIIVTIWSIFESGITDVAVALKSERHQTLDLSDLRGDDFLDRAKKYFRHVLDLPLIVQGKEWQCIKMLYVLRSAIVHGNGRIANINKKNRELIESIEIKNVGLSTDMGYLMLSKEFVEEVFRCVNVYLSRLIDDVKKRNFTEGSEHGNA